MPVSSDLVIFAHIPKTAGTTLYGIAGKNYNTIHSFYRGWNKHGTTLRDWVKDYNTHTDSQRPVFLRGHFGVGIHTFLNAASCSYFTVLREPVDRVISHYYYIAKRKKIESTKDIRTFVQNQSHITLDNLQTRFLSGLGWQNATTGDTLYGESYSLPFGQCTDEMLTIAKKNLKDHVLFGLQEQFDESLELFASAFNWQHKSYQSKGNVNKNRPRTKDLAPELLDQIASLNQYDAELYRYAKQLFKKQFKTLNKKNRIIDSSAVWHYPVAPQVRAQPYKVQLEAIKALMLAQDYEASVKGCHKLLDQFPNNVQILSVLASSYEKLSRDNEAEQTYQTILDLEPKRVGLHQARLARLLARRGKHQEAVTHFQHAIASEAEPPDWVLSGLERARKILQQ